MEMARINGTSSGDRSTGRYRLYLGRREAGGVGMILAAGQHDRQRGCCLQLRGRDGRRMPMVRADDGGYPEG